LFDTIPKYEKQVFFANYKFFVGISNVVAPLLGGFLAVFLAGQTFLIFTGLPILFVISFVLRMLTTIIFIPKIKPVRVKKKIIENIVAFKALSVYPVLEALHELGHLGDEMTYWKKIKIRDSKY